MTTVGPRAVHLPPIPAPTRPNLLSSVSAEPRPTEGRWQSGIGYQPPRYTGTGSTDPCEGGSKDITDSPSIVEWDPYIIWAGDQCSTFGDLAEVESRARGLLESQTSHLIEEILWTGLVDGSDFGDSHPNVSLADADVPTSPTPAVGKIYTPNAFNAVPIMTAFKDMIEALGDLLGGARGMIHLEKRLLPLVSFYGLAVQNGGRLLTTLGDHIVVAGTGYTGSDPDGGASSENYSWIYGTSMVEVLISPIEVPGSGSELVNLSTNEIEVRAERMALAHWDRQAHIGLGVCLEDPAGDCSDAGS